MRSVTVSCQRKRPRVKRWRLRFVFHISKTLSKTRIFACHSPFKHCCRRLARCPPRSSFATRPVRVASFGVIHWVPWNTDFGTFIAFLPPFLPFLPILESSCRSSSCWPPLRRPLPHWLPRRRQRRQQRSLPRLALVAAQAAPPFEDGAVGPSICSRHGKTIG